jgi:hypothetical protein
VVSEKKNVMDAKPQLFLYFLISLLDHIRNRIVKKNLIGPSMNHWDEHFTIKQTNNILSTSFLATDGPEIFQFCAKDRCIKIQDW